MKLLMSILAGIVTIFAGLGHSSAQAQAQAQADAEAAAQASIANSDLAARLSRLQSSGYLKYQDLPTLTQPTIGIVGDSLASGAMADLSVNASPLSLAANATSFALRQLHLAQADRTVDWAKLGAIKKETWTASQWRAPMRVFATAEKAPVGLRDSLGNSGSSFIDCEECSFGSQLAKLLNIPTANVFLAAQDGQRVSQTAEQFQRLTLPLGHLPNLILISWNANDICNIDDRASDIAAKTASYSKELLAQLKQAWVEGVPAPGGTDVVLLASADMVNVLLNPKILARPVTNFSSGSGPTITCGDLRRQAPAAHDLGNLINKMCDNILTLDISDSVGVEHLRQLHLSVVQAQAQVVRDFNLELARSPELTKKALRLYFVDDLRKIDFDGQDVGNDCFHPSVFGQRKIANSILNPIQAILDQK